MATRLITRAKRTRINPVEPVPGIPPAPETALPGYELIDDGQTSARRTWSSQRIAQAIGAGGGGEGGETGPLATVASTGSYGDLVDVPAEFPPEDHGHPINDIDLLAEVLAGKSSTGHGHGTATTVAAGFMSAEDKTKLDSLQAWVVLTQAAYDALTPPNPGTLYIVVG